MLRKLTPVLFVMLMTIATGSPAIAQELRRAASYRDLDLTSAAGVRQLRHRVVRAVNHVCRIARPDILLLSLQDRRCRQDAMNQAEPQIARAIQAAGHHTDGIQLAGG